jgi:hypothetical protein
MTFSSDLYRSEKAMDEHIILRVFEIVGSGLCVASEDGQKVYNQILAALREKRKVRLSFLNVENLTSAFLNAAIGQLYSTFSEDEIRASLSVSDIDKDDLALLKRVVDMAKQYFKDPERFRSAKQNILGVSDEE